MIKEKSVVSMTYVLRDDARMILDASIGGPFVFLQGYNNIIPGLEKGLMGLTPGDKKMVSVPPEEGYGAYDSNLVLTVPKEQFGQSEIVEGQQVQLTAPNGQPFIATVMDVSNGQVKLDANHPLAGKSLHFEVEILDVRDATAEELDHGHPHDPNNPHHHH